MLKVFIRNKSQREAALLVNQILRQSIIKEEFSKIENYCGLIDVGEVIPEFSQFILQEKDRILKLYNAKSIIKSIGCYGSYDSYIEISNRFINDLYHTWLEMILIVINFDNNAYKNKDFFKTHYYKIEIQKRYRLFFSLIIQKTEINEYGVNFDHGDLIMSTQKIMYQQAFKNSKIQKKHKIHIEVEKKSFYKSVVNTQAGVEWKDYIPFLNNYQIENLKEEIQIKNLFQLKQIQCKQISHDFTKLFFSFKRKKQEAISFENNLNHFLRNNLEYPFSKHEFKSRLDGKTPFFITLIYELSILKYCDFDPLVNVLVANNILPTSNQRLRQYILKCTSGKGKKQVHIKKIANKIT